jgi:hypothetical protein
MAKLMILDFHGTEHSFFPKRIDCAKLYGVRKFIAVSN